MTSSPKYSCDLCKKVFQQKIDLTRHKNKKAPCITLTEIQEIAQKNIQKQDNKTGVIQVFKNCLNVLRDNEGLTGDKALRVLSYFLILKLLEPHFGGVIDIDNYEYDFTHIDDNVVDDHKHKLLEISRFSALAMEKEDNIPINIKYLWDDILSVHPVTKNIFLKGRGFDLKYKTTYKKIIDIIHAIDLSTTEHDVLGDAYEEVIQYVMIGRELGQHFTPTSVKKMMVGLINPKIHENGKIDTFCDPTMGTGGFLITYLKHILQQAEAKNITLDWDFIKTEGLYGKEIEPDTFQLAVSNMLISSGHMFEHIERGDSIREPITRKFDNILANPPFGIKGLRYDDFQSSIKNEYVPIKTDAAVSLFIQAIVYMLNIGGKCAVVLPDGQDLFSKTNTTLVAIRELLMKTCDLTEVIYLPSGIFTNTTIKTCVFKFEKKKEGREVLETKIKISKTQKETGREYKFSKVHQTTKIKFYDYNPYEDVKNLLVEVPIEKIASNYYSLNYAEYMKDETEEEQYEEGIIVKTLGEVCKFDIGGTPSRSKNEYYENGKNLWVSVRELNGGYIYDTNEKITDLGVKNSSVKLFAKDTILFSFKLSIGKTAIVGNPLYTNEAIAGIISKDNGLLNNKYLYYYLTIHDFSKLGSGILGNGSLNKKSLAQIKIPIPSIERQQEIVKYLDFIYEKSNKTSNEKIAELKMLNEFCLNNQKIFGDNVVKTLGQVCDMSVKGNTNSKEISNTGEYQFYKASVSNPSGTHNTFCFDDIEYLLFIKSGGNSSNPLSLSHGIGKVYLVNGKSSGNTEVVKIKNNELVMLKYLYYYLQNEQLNIQKLAKYSTNLGHIDMNKFKEFKIHIPSLERQEKIVEYCDYNDTLVKQLEKEIENNKKQAHQFISSIIKVVSDAPAAAPTENIPTNDNPPSYENLTNDVTINDNSEQTTEPVVKKVKKIIKIKRSNINV